MKDEMSNRQNTNEKTFYMLDAEWKSLVEQSEKLNDSILTRRDGQAIDADFLWQSAKNDLVKRWVKLL